jgi:hypothetical protein
LLAGVMSVQSLLHEVLLALVGHTGDFVQPVLRSASSADEHQPPHWIVAGLELVAELPVSAADRTAINVLLRCGFHYTALLAFVQSVDEGATLETYTMLTPTALNTVAANVDALRRLDAQQARSVYSAASRMLSPPRGRRPPESDRPPTATPTFGREELGALVPVQPLHPLLEEKGATKGASTQATRMRGNAPRLAAQSRTPRVPRRLS